MGTVCDDCSCGRNDTVARLVGGDNFVEIKRAPIKEAATSGTQKETHLYINTRRVECT